jgi:hypothetical protein
MAVRPENAVKEIHLPRVVGRPKKQIRERKTGLWTVVGALRV